MSTLTVTSPNERRRRGADRLWLAATVLLALMPVAMAVAHRSSPLVLALVLAAALAAASLEGVLTQVMEEAGRALLTPLGLSVVGFLAWGALSIAWSAAPVTSLSSYREFALTLCAAFVVAVALPRRMPPHTAALVAAAVAAACLVITIDLWTNLALRREIGVEWSRFIFNRPVLTILVLTIPLASLLRREGQGRTAAVVLLVVAATLLQAESGAAVLGAAAAAAAFVLARLWRRGAVALAGAAVVAAIALAPVSGDVAGRVLPASLHEAIASTSSRTRVQIWKVFGAAVRENPIIGAGFGVSPRLAETSALQQAAPEERVLLGVGHPHSAALQIWVELGLVGALAAAAIVLLVLRRLARLPSELVPPSLALFAAVSAVSLVGHGAWQGWWPAAIGAAVVLIRFGPAEPAGPRS